MLSHLALLCLAQVASAFVFVSEVQKLSPDSIARTTTPVGEILGRMSTLSIDGNAKHVTTYKGIPFAESPVGNLRFEKPVPKAPFRSPFDATNPGPRCLQSYGEARFNYSEDCLTLNIFVPSSKVSSTNSKAVMVWIYGGSFQNGDSAKYYSERLSANGDVIVVTINYRLAQLGFLRINSSYIPGNFGLWDQHLAIKWVHNNIGAFGGDVNRVTVFGESSGSCSVLFQATYPGNKGLFQRGIAESGSSANTWSQMDESRAADGARRFAATLGCNRTDDTRMMQCLRQVPSDDMMKAMNASAYDSNAFYWTPAFDGDFVATEQSEMFKLSPATASSLDFFRSLDMIIGNNRAEGLTSVRGWATSDYKTFAISRQYFENDVIPYYLGILNHHKNVPDSVTDAVKFGYTTWENPDDMVSRLRNFVDFLTDFDFVVPTLDALDARNASSGQSYMYEFAFRPSHPQLGGIPSLDADDMANHGDELAFVFDSLGANVTSEETRMAKAVSTMWTNFAKTGDPNNPVDISQYYPVDWQQYDPEKQRYLELSHQPAMKERLNARRVALWRDLIPALEQHKSSSAV